MDPEEVLELMDDAEERYETVRAALRYRGDGPTMKLLRRKARLEASRRGEAVSSQSSEQIQYSEPDGTFGWQCRIWHVDGYHWRRELDLPGPGGGIEVSACNGSAGVRPRPMDMPKMWRLRDSSDPSGEDPEWLWVPKDHYWTFYLVADISGLSGVLGELDLRVEGEMQWAGRRALRLVGVPPAEEWKRQDDPDPLQWGADEYELLVDAERGVVLRCANKLKGIEFDVLEMEEVYFDEYFAEEMFAPPEPRFCW